MTDTSDSTPETDEQHARRQSSHRDRLSAENRSPEWPFGSAADGTPEAEHERSEGPAPGWGLRAQPDVDIAEDPTEIHVWCDLPGCEEDSVELSGDEWTLNVTAERAEQYWAEGDIHRRERSSRAERSIALPARSDVDDAEATLDDGVLHVRLPKHESEHTRSIGIQ